MDAQKLQSWKFALAVTAGLTIVISGYRMMFGQDLATRIEERRIAIAFPGGRPNEEIMRRQVVAATPYVGMQYSLQQLARFLESRNHELAWEPLSPRAFVLRASGLDALTGKPFEWAFQFALLDGPFVDGQPIGTFTGPVVAVESMAADGQIMDHAIITASLAEIANEVRQQPQ